MDKTISISNLKTLEHRVKVKGIIVKSLFAFIILFQLLFASISCSSDEQEIGKQLSKPSNFIQNYIDQNSEAKYIEQISPLDSVSATQNIAQLLRTSDLTPAYAFRGVAIVDDYAYATSREGGYLLVYKLDNIRKANTYLGNVYQVSYLAINGAATTIARMGNYLYVGGDCISIINISNRSSPQLVKTINYSAYRSIKVIGNYLISSDSKSYIFDITNPAAPMCLSTFGDHTDATIYKTTLYAGEWISTKGVRVYDISDIHNMREIKFIPLDGDVYHVDIMNNNLFAVAEQFSFLKSFLYSFSLVNPADPSLNDSLQFNGLGRAFGITNAFCVIGSGTAAYVVDITDPKSMSVISTINDLGGTQDGFPFDISISRNLVSLLNFM